MRPTRALIDPNALRYNFTRVRTYAPSAKVMAVVKANGYGHGLEWTAKTLSDAHAFGVASVEDGAVLRDAGIKQPICLLEGFFHPDELPSLVRYQLSSVVHHDSQLWDLEHAGKIEPIDVWVKVDTGMHRLGFPAGGFTAGDHAPQGVYGDRACAAVVAFRHRRQSLRLRHAVSGAYD